MDYYDKAVEHFTKNPELILEGWLFPFKTVGGFLFAYCTETREFHHEGKLCGCVAQVKSGDFPAQTDSLTAAIAADSRLPSRIDRYSGDTLTVEHLPLFAEWQRKIDAELGREPPIWTEGATA